MPERDDLIYMVGELYVQRRMEQMLNAKLLEKNSELETEIQKLKEGGNND